MRQTQPAWQSSSRDRQISTSAGTACSAGLCRESRWHLLSARGSVGVTPGSFCPVVGMPNLTAAPTGASRVTISLEVICCGSFRSICVGRIPPSLAGGIEKFGQIDLQSQRQTRKRVERRIGTAGFNLAYEGLSRRSLPPVKSHAQAASCGHCAPGCSAVNFSIP